MRKWMCPRSIGISNLTWDCSCLSAHPDSGPDSKLGLLASGEAAKVVRAMMGGCTGYPDCPADGTDCYFEHEYGVNCDEAAMGARMPVNEERIEDPDLDYDARRLNWPRLAERMLSSTYNALFYGALIVAAKALGIL